MSERIHVLAQQLFAKASIDECDLQEIKDLANRYPYFAPAQFLLLEKLKRENAPEYTAQLQKSVLYYHNPLEFEYFISSERFETEIDFEESYQPSTNIYDQANSFEADIVPEETGILNEERKDEKINTEEEFHQSMPVELPTVETSEALTEAEPKVDYVETTLADAQMAEAIERVLKQEEEQVKEPSQQKTNNDIVFEPYHTVDYFASQGIKLSQQESTTDKFGKQLKSFTEWLKSMKRLPATEISKNVDASSESKVQHLAEDSVQPGEVVTEAMAEVWVKQGNKEKAIETYNKLGLLNPSKRAYFAGLIENLKHS